MGRPRADAIREIRHELRRLEGFRAIAVAAAMLAHEIRNPLSSIAFTVELELEESATPAHEALRSVLRSCEQASARLTELLALVRAPTTDPAIAQRIDALCAPLERVSDCPRGHRVRPARPHRTSRSSRSPTN